MLILGADNNAVILVDEINTQITEDEGHYAAIFDGCISRLRPSFLTVITTILGILPLLTDVFFACMAVTIMPGLAFATLLILIGVSA